MVLCRYLHTLFGALWCSGRTDLFACMGGCIYNKCNILPIIQKKSIKDLLSGFILPAVTTDAVWFTVGSFVCLLSPVNTIVTRWVHVSRVTCLSITRVTRVQVRDQPRRVRGRDRPHLLRARAVLGGECHGHGHVSQCDTCDTCAGERVPGGGGLPTAVLGHAGHAAGRGVPAGAGRPPARHRPLQHHAQEVVQSFVMRKIYIFCVSYIRLKVNISTYILYMKTENIYIWTGSMSWTGLYWKGCHSARAQ